MNIEHLKGSDLVIGFDDIEKLFEEATSGTLSINSYKYHTECSSKACRTYNYYYKVDTDKSISQIIHDIVVMYMDYEIARRRMVELEYPEHQTIINLNFPFINEALGRNFKERRFKVGVSMFELEQMKLAIVAKDGHQMSIKEIEEVKNFFDAILKGLEYESTTKNIHTGLF